MINSMLFEDLMNKLLIGCHGKRYGNTSIIKPFLNGQSFLIETVLYLLSNEVVFIKSI